MNNISQSSLWSALERETYVYVPLPRFNVMSADTSERGQTEVSVTQGTAASEQPEALVLSVSR